MMTILMGGILSPIFCRRLALASVLLVSASTAHAQSAFGESSGTVERIAPPTNHTSAGDGVYGRFNGDVSLQIGAGVEADLPTPSLRPLITGDVTLYQTAGLYGSYRYGLATADPVGHVMSAGAVVSPLFLFRWSRDLAIGSPTIDLAIDSLSLHGGLLMRALDGGSLFDQVGAEFGLGWGLPLMGRANGLWLRTRGQLHTGDDLGGAAWLWLSWQGFIHTGLLKVDR